MRVLDSATLWPFLKGAAATIRIAALMNRANISATSSRGWRFDRFALAFRRFARLARLNDARMR